MSDKNLPEIFADSLSSVMVGYPISKISFRTATQNLEGSFEYERNLVLAIPTASLAEACKVIIENFNENHEALTAGAKTHQIEFENILQSINSQPSN